MIIKAYFKEFRFGLAIFKQRKNTFNDFSTDGRIWFFSFQLCKISSSPYWGLKESIKRYRKNKLEFS